MLERRQTRDLLAWASESGRVIAPETYLPLVEDSGSEHRVWLDQGSQRYFKATFPGQFSFSVTALPELGLELVQATPLEYLERWRLQNCLFGDDARLEGVANEESGLAILMSQPNVTGDAVTPEEITAFFRKLWFQPLSGLELGNPGALAFYRDLDEVAAFDAHPGNFVKDGNGVILPIDLILVRADAALQSALQAFTS